MVRELSVPLGTRERGREREKEEVSERRGERDRGGHTHTLYLYHSPCACLSPPISLCSLSVFLCSTSLCSLSLSLSIPLMSLRVSSQEKAGLDRTNILQASVTSRREAKKERERKVNMRENEVEMSLSLSLLSLSLSHFLPRVAHFFATPLSLSLSILLLSFVFVAGEVYLSMKLITSFIFKHRDAPRRTSRENA